MAGRTGEDVITRWRQYWIIAALESASAVEENRHEYVFDASRVNISTLLEQAAAQTQVLDVETHRAPH